MVAQWNTRYWDPNAAGGTGAWIDKYVDDETGEESFVSLGQYNPDLSPAQNYAGQELTPPEQAAWMAAGQANLLPSTNPQNYTTIGQPDASGLNPAAYAAQPPAFTLPPGGRSPAWTDPGYQTVNGVVIWNGLGLGNNNQQGGAPGWRDNDIRVQQAAAQHANDAGPYQFVASNNPTAPNVYRLNPDGTVGERVADPGQITGRVLTQASPGMSPARITQIVERQQIPTPDGAGWHLATAPPPGDPNVTGDPASRPLTGAAGAGTAGTGAAGAAGGPVAGELGLSPQTEQVRWQRMQAAAQAALQQSQTLGYLVEPVFTSDFQYTFRPVLDAQGRRQPTQAVVAQYQAVAAQRTGDTGFETEAVLGADGQWQFQPVRDAQGRPIPTQATRARYDTLAAQRSAESGYQTEAVFNDDGTWTLRPLLDAQGRPLLTAAAAESYAQKAANPRQSVEASFLANNRGGLGGLTPGNWTGPGFTPPPLSATSLTPGTPAATAAAAPQAANAVPVSATTRAFLEGRTIPRFGLPTYAPPGGYVPQNALADLNLTQLRGSQYLRMLPGEQERTLGVTSAGGFNDQDVLAALRNSLPRFTLPGIGGIAA